MFLELDSRLRWMQQMVRVNAMDYVNLMSCVSQRVRQSIDVHRITAKAVWRVKSCQM
jgi:hypothetical protein